MSVQLVATGVTFPDATTQTTAAISNNQIVMTASGSIALGKLLLQQADGTVIQMTGSNPAVPNATYIGGFFSGDTTGNISQTAAAALNSAGNTIVAVTPVTNSTSIQVIVGTISGSSITWGTPVLLTAATSSKSGATSVTYDIGQAKWVVWYNVNGSASTIAARTISVTGSTPTLGTAVNISTFGTTSGYTFSASYDVNSGKHVVTYPAVTTGYPTANVLTVTGTTVAYGTAVVLESSALSNGSNSLCKLQYDPASLKQVVCWGSGATTTVKLNTATVSGTTVTLGTALNTGLIASAGEINANEMLNTKTQIVIDSTRSKYILTNSYYVSASNIYTFEAAEFTLSGTTFSGPNYLTFSDLSTDYNFTFGASYIAGALYDSNNGVLTLTDNVGGIHYYKYTTVANPDIYQLIADSQSGAPSLSCILIKLSATAYIYITNLADTSFSYLYVYTFTLTPATSNRNLGEIIGVANGTYTNGQAASVIYEGSGSYVSGLSGLTLNTPYYFDTANTLTADSYDATPNGLTMRSLTTTTLLVM